ncbi:hypothetical protein B0H67DRAFT_565350 [Lasiosphaeris hirsuta]|uniref:Secreted protein n=1 Tax=Lasiosphaeris hirsuta TaxID=260670 RepID=A0AA40BCA2_9PEZI|nr:hypothetical protein B0H67DRAFT_565350 [Lasiosphaeris hirsuta]
MAMIFFFSSFVILLFFRLVSHPFAKVLSANEANVCAKVPLQWTVGSERDSTWVQMYDTDWLAAILGTPRSSTLPSFICGTYKTSTFTTSLISLLARDRSSQDELPTSTKGDAVRQNLHLLACITRITHAPPSFQTSQTWHLHGARILL